MIGYYNYTVILTYMSLVSSVIGMFFAVGYGGTRPHPEYAIICLMVSGLCDMFDGKVARTKKDRTESEKKFGIQIDSLCDCISFGIQPAVLVYFIACGYGEGSEALQIIALCVGLAFALCAVIRLAYFNVTEEERQEKEAYRLSGTSRYQFRTYHSGTL